MKVWSVMEEHVGWEVVCQDFIDEASFVFLAVLGTLKCMQIERIGGDKELIFFAKKSYL